MNAVLENIELLSASEKILMVEELWDNVAKTSDDVSIPEWQKEELDRRRKRVRKGEGSLCTWSQILADVQQ